MLGYRQARIHENSRDLQLWCQEMFRSSRLIIFAKSNHLYAGFGKKNLLKIWIRFWSESVQEFRLGYTQGCPQDKILDQNLIRILSKILSKFFSRFLLDLVKVLHWDEGQVVWPILLLHRHQNGFSNGFFIVIETIYFMLSLIGLLLVTKLKYWDVHFCI